MTLPSDNPLRFRKIILKNFFTIEYIIKIITTDDQIKDEKL